jgi:ectoine hydroxylase-related dioxygenase (phytanoyl-CoA dioxygenase family)
MQSCNHAIIQSHNHTVTGIFFSQLFSGQDSPFYELSSLISDPSALSQRVHTDTTFQSKCPLYTVFIALQDVTEDMGPTVFIPGTHTAEAHSSLRHNRDNFLASSSYARALLSAGDAVVMDSRLMHCGDGNIASTRRVLMYFTLRNPDFSDMGGGSLHSHLSLSLHQVGGVCGNVEGEGSEG